MAQQPQQQVSLTALMKSNARLKAAVATAKQVQVPSSQNFAGPPGDYICKFAGLRISQKNNNTYMILDFRIDGSVDGQKQYNGQSLACLHGLQDGPNSTAEQNLERFFADIQRLGIDTAEASLEQIEAALKGLVGKLVTMKVVPNKRGDGTYTNIKGLAAAGSTTPPFAESDDEDSSATADDSGDDASQSDVSEEWDDELQADAASDEEEAKPSEWVGFDVQYKPLKAPKPLTFKVLSADDAAGTVVLEREGKKIKAKFDDLILE
jgi:hypothetical protein